MNFTKSAPRSRPTPPDPRRGGVSLGEGRPAIGGEKPVLCVPLVARGVDEALEQLPRLAARQPDLIEVRLDFLDGLTSEGTGPLLAQMKALCDVPLLATFRSPDEGGARLFKEDERAKFLSAAIRSGAIRLVDVELAVRPGLRNGLMEEAHRAGVATIVSYHNFHATPPYHILTGLLQEMAGTGADILKLAVQPREPQDTLTLLAVTHEATSTWLDRPLVAMSLGNLGSFTRLAGSFFGSAMTFAIGETSSAPGQLQIDTVRELWQNWDVRSE